MQVLSRGFSDLLLRYDLALTLCRVRVCVSVRMPLSRPRGTRQLIFLFDKVQLSNKGKKHYTRVATRECLT